MSYYKEHNAKLDILPLEMKTLFSYFINKEDPYTILEYLFKISLAEIKILTKNIDMKKIRFFTTEDEADILAHKILIQTKYRDSLVKLTSHFIGNEKKQKRCKEFTKNGKEPSYGLKIDPHHGDCWRYWRAKELLKI